MKQLALLIIVILLAALAGCQSETALAPASANATLIPLTVCESSSAIGSWPFVYATQEDLFSQYGLQIDAQNMSSGTAATTALLAGDADICQISGASVVNAALATEGPVIIAGIINRQPYSLVVESSIEQPSDLVGKVLAVSSPGSSSDTILRAALQQMGLDPENDVTTVSAGRQAERLAALQSGQVAGSLFTLSELGNATVDGYRILLGVEDIDVPWQHAAVVTTRDFLDNNPAVVESYLKVLIAATAALSQDMENGPEIIITGLEISGEREQENIRAVYPTTVTQYLERVPYPSREGVTALIAAGQEENATARQITADDVIDDTIVAELEASGFIDELYGEQ